MTAPNALQPTAALGERVLLPGDPGRALRLARVADIRAAPRCSTTTGACGVTRGYGARTASRCTIQSTGMGGPSAGDRGRTSWPSWARGGWCGWARAARCSDGVWRSGTWSWSTEALAADGTSRALGAGDAGGREPVDLLAAVIGEPPDAPGPDHRGAGGVPATCSTTAPTAPESGLGCAAGALAVEMEAATLFTLADARGVQAAGLAVVRHRPPGANSDRRGRTPRRRAADGRRGAARTSPPVIAGDRLIPGTLGQRRLQSRQ